MDVEDVDVVRLELLEGRLDRDMERLHVVPGERALLLDVIPPALEVPCILY